VLYHPAFRFFLPEVEGRFLALKKTLAHLSLADASSAVALQNVMDQNTGQAFHWKAQEQVLGLTPRIQDYFASKSYLDNVIESEKQSRFRLIQDSKS
jgi:hypothetical protein